MAVLLFVNRWQRRRSEERGMGLFVLRSLAGAATPGRLVSIGSIGMHLDAFAAGLDSPDGREVAAYRKTLELGPTFAGAVDRINALTEVPNGGAR